MCCPKAVKGGNAEPNTDPVSCYAPFPEPQRKKAATFPRCEPLVAPGGANRTTGYYCTDSRSTANTSVALGGIEVPEQ